MRLRNRFQGINSGSLCSLAGRYDNPIPPRFLAPIDCLKIPAQESTEQGRRLADPSNLTLLIVHPCGSRSTDFGVGSRKMARQGEKRRKFMLRKADIFSGWRRIPEFDIPPMMNIFFCPKPLQVFGLQKPGYMKFRCIESESKTAMLTTLS
jgi:hypothetical protein